jgi:phosphocarrier protein
MIQIEIEVKNPQGIHARPAAMIAEVANRFACEVILVHNGREADGKSILSLLTLSAPQGSRLLLRISGEDEESARSALIQLFSEGFGEIADPPLKTA